MIHFKLVVFDDTTRRECLISDLACMYKYKGNVIKGLFLYIERGLSFDLLVLFVYVNEANESFRWTYGNRG